MAALEKRSNYSVDPVEYDVYYEAECGVILDSLMIYEVTLQLRAGVGGFSN